MEQQTTYGNGTPQISEFCGTKDWVEIEWDCGEQTTLPTCRFPKPPSADYVERRKRLVQAIEHRLQSAGYVDCDIVDTTIPRQTTPIEHAPDDGMPLGYSSSAQWNGQHPLNSQLVNLVSRIDYATSDEDMAQDMILSLLQRSHTVRNAGDWRNAVRYALLDARRKAAQLSRTGESLESIAYDPDRDHRKEQLPGPMKPYDGPEPPVMQSLPTIPQHIIRAKVESAERQIGQFRFNRQCQVSAYTME